MFTSEPTLTTRHLRSTIVAVLVVVGAVLVGAVGYGLLPPTSSPLVQDRSVAPVETLGQPGMGPRETAGLDRDDGMAPDGLSVFGDEYAAVTELDPALLDAVRRAATAAAENGVQFVVNSGWRSPEYQEKLLREATVEYGSATEAARWVATPETSAHVSGHAIDLGPSHAAAWLSEHGAEYGLCQIYDNEPWHFELRRGAVRSDCPVTYADPTHDPRMQS